MRRECRSAATVWRQRHTPIRRGVADRQRLDDRRVVAASIRANRSNDLSGGSQSRATSSAGAEWVISPTLIRSTPVERNLADRVQRHAAGGLQLDGRRNRVAAGDGLAERVGPHVVQEHDVRAGGEHVVELVEVVDFDFDEQRLAVALGGGLREEVAGAADGVGGRDMFSPAASARWLSLIEHGVEQAGAMIRAAAAADGIFFESPPAGRRLAGVVDAWPWCRRFGGRIRA